MASKKVAIDLGGWHVRVHDQDKILIDIPNFIALDSKLQVVAIGEQAQELKNKTKDLKVISPFQFGSVTNYAAGVKFMEHVWNQIWGRFNFIKPEVLLPVPYGLSSIEQRTTTQLFTKVGAAKIYYFPNPVCTVLGAGLSTKDLKSNFVINIGFEHVEIGLVLKNEVTYYKIWRQGVSGFLTLVKEYLVKELKTEASIEQIRRAFFNFKDEPSFNFVGKDTKGGFQNMVEVSADKVQLLVRNYFAFLLDGLVETVQAAPVEIMEEIMERGILISGGGAYLPHIDDLVTKASALPAYVSEKPELDVITGAGKVLRNLEDYL